MIRGHVELKTRGRYTPFRYVSAVFLSSWRNEWEIFEKAIRELPDDEREAKLKEKARLLEGIWRLRSEIIRDSGKALDTDGFVHDYDEMDRIIRRHAGGRLDGWGDLISFDPGLRQPDPKTSYGDLDKVFVVFDRDREMYPDKRTDEDYRKVFEECGSLGYEILLSTPMFEFWLLLHHEGVDAGEFSPYLDYKYEVLEALRDREMTGCSDWDLGVDGVKGISKERMTRFYGNEGFRTALEQSKRLPTDLEGLLNSVGSNVGIELEALLMHRGLPSPF